MTFNFTPQVYAKEENEGINLGEEFTVGTNETGLVKDIFKTPADMVNLIANNLMVLGGIILFFMIIMAGFKFIKDDTKAKQESKDIMKAAIGGFVLLFSAYWIVQIVQVITGAKLGF